MAPYQFCCCPIQKLIPSRSVKPLRDREDYQICRPDETLKFAWLTVRPLQYSM